MKQSNLVDPKTAQVSLENSPEAKLPTIELQEQSMGGSGYRATDVVIARTVKDLPPLKEGFARVVHITAPEAAEEIALTGLDYLKNGVLRATARSWSDSAQVEFGSSDSRFSSPRLKCVVLDLSFAELRLHESFKAPGRVTAGAVVGIVPANQG